MARTSLSFPKSTHTRPLYKTVQNRLDRVLGLTRENLTGVRVVRAFRVKTDRKDAVKIANYTLDKWTRLRQYLPEDDTRLALKNCYRQYQQAVAIRTMLKNNLISSLDLTFPDANKLFTSPAKSNGCEKWVDFIGDFWHSECISSLSANAFAKKYLKWCQKHGYVFTRSKSDEIYACVDVGIQ